MSPHYMWSLLCNNNIIQITTLFEICSIYGQSHENELKIIFNELFCEKLYKKNLKNSIELMIYVSYLIQPIKFNICIKHFQLKNC